METTEQARADYYREIAVRLTAQEEARRRARADRMLAELVLRLTAAAVIGIAVIFILAHAWPAFVAYQSAEQDRLDREQIGLETAYHEQALDSLLRSHPQTNPRF